MIKGAAQSPSCQALGEALISSLWICDQVIALQNFRQKEKGGVSVVGDLPNNKWSASYSV